MYPPEYLNEVLGQWGLVLKRTCPEWLIQGSPERTSFRIVIETSNDEKFILEQVSAPVRQRKQNIAQVLFQLKERGLAGVLPYRKSEQGEFLVEMPGGFWQMVPFCEGVELDRPNYLKDSWRGEALAEFAIALRRCSDNLAIDENETSFSLREYNADFLKRLQRYDPELLDPVRPAADLVRDELFPHWDDIPSCFAHGDIHPINVIWGPQSVRAVIDWEFMGQKKEIYDIANLIGCLGMEHPSGLQGEMVLSLLSRIKASAIYSPESLALLPVFILAQRFPWLAEWLRKRDFEMVDLEITYIRLLKDSLLALRESWGLDPSKV